MSLRLAPYPAYKDSGVPWLGEAPAHWRLSPGFAVYREKQHKNSGMAETSVLSLSYGSVVVKSADKLHGLVPESFETYQIVDPGEIIIRPTDLQNDHVSLRVGAVNDRGIITSAYLCLRTIGEMTADYGYLLLHAYDLKKVFYGMGSGLRQNLDFTDLKRMPALVPTRDEQYAIARFLDHADRRIDRLVRAKRRLIALLNEQKQAIIHRAVTRRLDPNVRLKPSGVEWLGDVPEDWEVRRLKFLAHIKTGGRDTVDRKHDGMYSFFVRSQTVERIDSYSFDGEAVLTAGDGAGVAKVFHYVNGKFDYHQRVYKFSNFRKVRGKFFLHYFSCTLRFEAFRETAKSTVDSLRLPMLQNFPVALPPPEEQDVIVAAVERETQDIDRSLVSIRREIELVREYRARLVADVVTGKLDVREAAANLPDESDEPEVVNEAEEIEEAEAAEEADAIEAEE